MLLDDFLDPISVTLLDTRRVTWPREELVDYTNEAIRATVAIKTDLFPKRDALSMEAGTLQMLPEDGVAVFDIDDNVTSGKIVTLVDRELLDESNRFWPAGQREVDVDHWCVDPRDPRRFSITPPNDGTGAVNVLYGALPPALTGSSGEDILLNDTNQPILTNYVLGKAYAKNSKRQDLAKSTAYMNQWAALVGLKSKAMIAVAPKVAVSEGKA